MLPIPSVDYLLKEMPLSYLIICKVLGNILNNKTLLSALSISAIEEMCYVQHV